ncbi:MAG: HEAT repeat domain-containing protein [Pirellulales bacterium]|nr:HEAT repeat domain-containing protein [Pirellulales bacterium]
MTTTACRTLVCLVLVMSLVGCAKLRAPWTKSAKQDVKSRADVYASRQEELAQLADQAGKLTSAEQDRIAAELQQELSNEANPVMRDAIVRTLGAMKSPGSLAALKHAMGDTDKYVRARVCESLGRRRDAEAAAALSEIISTDSESHVRLAAARALGRIDDPQSVQGLGVALQDGDPALQHRAMESLRAVTHRDFGNDVGAWREFVQGGNPAEPQPTIAERLRSIF